MLSIGKKMKNKRDTGNIIWVMSFNLRQPLWMEETEQTFPYLQVPVALLNLWQVALFTHGLVLSTHWSAATQHNTHKHKHKHPAIRLTETAIAHTLGAVPLFCLVNSNHGDAMWWDKPTSLSLTHKQTHAEPSCGSYLSLFKNCNFKVWREKPWESHLHTSQNKKKSTSQKKADMQTRRIQPVRPTNRDTDKTDTQTDRQKKTDRISKVRQWRKPDRHITHSKDWYWGCLSQWDHKALLRNIQHVTAILAAFVYCLANMQPWCWGEDILLRG